ncbi:MFS transporter [Aquabacterium sp. OR-4]|uniref:MFS transporter n=1 Tax=Aquabacterium sp. OR-4 TaxID=2978127 RepID=UPI0028CA28FD|nr:MFS transporter [Aquabacterium sp. OR-4]MDT7837372.1 MFS transporter [Aquabacterium sp. OR-4]
MAANGGAGGPGYWATVAGLAVGQVLAWAVLFYAFSSLVLPMGRELGWQQATLMGAFTLGLAVSGVTGYAVGAAIDAGRGRRVMTAGAVLGGLGCLGWSLVSAPWMLYAVWAVLGAAMAMTLYEPAFAVLTKRYPERYAHGITMLTLLGGFASTLSFPAVAWLLQWGWRASLQVMGLLLLLGVAPLHAWALRGPMLVATPPRADAQADATLHQALRHSAFWLLTLCFTLYSFSQSAFWSHVMPAFADRGATEAEAVKVLMIIGPAQVAGRLLYVFAGRAWSLRVVGVGVLLTLPLSYALLALGSGPLVWVAFATAFGIANGLVTIVRGALVPQFFGRAHIGRIGGLMGGIGAVSRAFAPVAASGLLVWLGGYRGLLLALCLLGLVAVVCFGLARRPSAR